MRVFVGSVGEHLREDGEVTTVADDLAPAGVRRRVPVAKTLAGASHPPGETRADAARRGRPVLRRGFAEQHRALKSRGLEATR